jgi:predicted dehydrogenase
MLTGREVRRVFARTTAHFHQVNVDNHVEDLASLTLEMDDGIPGSVTVGRIGSASHQSGGEIRLRVLGSEGALVIDESLPTVSLYYRNQPLKDARQRRIANENDFLLADNFAQAIDHDLATILDVRASQAIFLTIEAAIKSCRTNQPEEIGS